MGSTDKESRKYAVPIRGTIWGLNYNDRTERDIGQRTFAGRSAASDYSDYFPGKQYEGSTINPLVGATKQCPLRILQPHYGELAQCFADIDINVAAGDSDLTLKLGIGRLQSGTYDRVTSYTDAEINAAWRKIRGSDAPLTVSGGKLSADLLNLLPALPKYGDADYRKDVFVLVLVFNKVPTLTGTFKFNYLNIHNSVTGVL